MGVERQWRVYYFGTVAGKKKGKNVKESAVCLVGHSIGYK